MEMNEYQKKAMTTAIYPRHNHINLIYPSLGLVGEAGEVAEKMKKVFRDNDCIVNQKTKDSLKKEIGDVLWYVAILSKELGFSLEEIAQFNIDKLASRKERNVLNGNGDER